MSNHKHQSHVQFRRIGWKNFLDVYKLSRSLLPSELCRKRHTMFALLFNLERHNHNLSFGLYVDNTIIGYMLVYFHERSLFHQRDEIIVHIDEYCVQSQYRGQAREVIATMVREMSVWQQKPGIEAIATGDVLEHWLSLGRFVHRYGYQTNLKENDCERGGHSMSRIRWQFGDKESWRPDTPFKLPSATSAQTVEHNNESYQVHRLLNPRQWLGLQDAINDLEPGNNNTYNLFHYAWQWWRHFGIDKELSVFAVFHNDELLGVAPMCIYSTDQGRKLGLMGGSMRDGSDPQVLIRSKSPEIAYVISKTVEAASQELNLSGTNYIPPPIPNSHCQKWFGFNSRNYELKRSFLAAIKPVR